MNLCKCGCGKDAKPGRDFLHGHNRGASIENKNKSLKPSYRKQYLQEYQAKNSEKLKAAKRRCELWAFYRITPEELLIIEAFQRSHPLHKLLLGKHMGTDHDHATGLIRGRLDWRLNRAYGLIEKVDPKNTGAILRALAEFHDNPPAVQALGEKRYGLIGIADYKKKMVYGPPKDK